MKFSAVLIALIASTEAFAPVSVNSRTSSVLGMDASDTPQNIDKSLVGIDAEGSFDPTSGDNPALARNNNNEVWNQQVSAYSSTVPSCFVGPRE